MNFMRRILLSRQLKKALARNQCRLDSGINGLRRDMELTLEVGVKLHRVKINSSKLSIGAYTEIVSATELQDVASIGRYCSIGRNVTIGQNRRSHPLNWLSTHHTLMGLRHHAEPIAHTPVAQTVIGHDVWIGMDVLILEGVTIGTGAVIGAQSLITKDVPPYAIITGSPGKVQRYRFAPEIIEALLASQWWNLSLAQLAELPIEDPEKLLEKLQGQAVKDCAMDTVTVRTRPFSVKHYRASAL